VVILISLTIQIVADAKRVVNKMQPPSEFRTIKQPNGSRLCGVAVAAMAVGKGLRYVLNRINTVSWPDGLQYARTCDVLEFLGSHGIFCGLICEPQRRLRSGDGMLFEMTLDSRPCIFTVPSETFEGRFHYVFWDGQRVRDPNPTKPETTRIEDYDVVSEIIPLTYIV